MSETPTIDDELNSKFISKERFTEEIELYVRKYGVNYIDAIVEYCNETGIEIETVPKLITKQLKEKIKFDAGELNYLKKKLKPKLPI